MHPTYVTFLKQNRDQFNSRFKLFQQSHRDLQDAVFFEKFKILLTCLPSIPPANGEELIKNMFSALLDLAGQDISLQLPRSIFAFECWLKVLPKSGELFSRHPSALLSRLANAALLLASAEEVRVEMFIEDMAKVAPLCSDVISLQNIGVVASWKAGLALLRTHALSCLEGLSDGLCLALFPQSKLKGSELSKLWQKNPWIDYTSSPNHQSTSRVTGGFIGYGGKFLKTPYLEARGEFFLVSDGIKHWRLSADVFGVSWERSQIPVKPDNSKNITFKPFGESFSSASTDHTTALTFASSLRVYLMAKIS